MEIELDTQNIYFLIAVIKDCHAIDGKSFFNQPVKNDMRTYDNIQKAATGQENDYTTNCPLD